MGTTASSGARGASRGRQRGAATHGRRLAARNLSGRETRPAAPRDEDLRHRIFCSAGYTARTTEKNECPTCTQRCGERWCSGLDERPGGRVAAPTAQTESQVKRFSARPAYDALLGIDPSSRLRSMGAPLYGAWRATLSLSGGRESPGGLGGVTSPGPPPVRRPTSTVCGMWTPGKSPKLVLLRKLAPEDFRPALVNTA